MYEVNIPLDVPLNKKEEYKFNFLKATHNTGKLMLFAGDQKIEHLNDDFYGVIKLNDELKKIPEDDSNPEHLFKIASHSRIGVFATQLGLISRYPQYKNIPFLVKLNSKTNLVKTQQKDPLSNQLWSLNQVLNLKDNGVNILGVGYTIYLGSEYEHIMLKEAANLIYEAHKNGLLVVLWMYPRGKSVNNEKDPHLIAGAAGVGACLGADFVKVNYPKSDNPKESFKEAIMAAGTTGVITAGGSSKPPREFLQETWDQINISGCRGNATGRNIHQKPLDKAIKFTNAIASIVLDNKSVDEALQIYGE